MTAGPQPYALGPMTRCPPRFGELLPGLALGLTRFVGEGLVPSRNARGESFHCLWSAGVGLPPVRVTLQWAARQMGACNVIYTPTVTGAQTLTASFAGSSTLAASSGSVAVVVGSATTVPELPTPLAGLLASVGVAVVYRLLRRRLP